MTLCAGAGEQIAGDVDPPVNRRWRADGLDADNLIIDRQPHGAAGAAIGCDECEIPRRAHILIATDAEIHAVARREAAIAVDFKQ